MSVLVVGGGPVGLTLGMDLASRGVDVLIVERRAYAEPPSVKCNHISARSMEIFRRLGVAGDLRSAGLPPDHPHDCAYRVTVVGTELARTVIPSRARRFTGDGADAGWPTPEPPHRINQIYTEPILARHAAAMPNVKMLNRRELIDLRQRADGILATVRDLEAGTTGTIACRFLVGCDGPRSTVRRLIGAALEGPPLAGRFQSTLIRAPGLMDAMEAGPAWTVSTWNRRRTGALFAIDGVDRFLVHNPLGPGEDYDTVDRDGTIRTILGVGPDFHFDVLSIEDFEGRGLVADLFRGGRVFLAGDAAHLWLPFAGYGMNAGIADAADLAWLLGAHLDGWAPEQILDAYERERRPVTGQVAGYAMGVLPDLLALSSQVPPEIEDPGRDGRRTRDEFGRRVYELNTPQFACAGLNFGYFYDDSPLIAYDGESAPAYTMGDYTPSTVPGCRAPHVWLEDHRSLYDVLGAGYTLLRRDATLDVSDFERAAAARDVPLEVRDLSGAEAAEAYDRALVLCRPDQHVAWRGDAPPDDVTELVERIRGAG